MDDKRMQKLLEAIINIIFTVIYLPIHILEKTIMWIQDNWRKGVEWFSKGILNLWKKWISKLFAPKDIHKKFKIFDEVWRTLTQMNSNLARDYQEEHVFMLVAFLLEVVSFFSTYEGNALYFSGLFYEAPFIIALVIQLGLLVSANTAFRHGKKMHATRLIMVLLLITSIFFSYTGLYIGNQSPKAEYDEAKKGYIDAYETALEELKAREPEDEKLYANAVYITSTTEMEIRNAEEVIKVLDERIREIGKPDKSAVSVIRETTENGETKSTTVTSADPEYRNISNMLDTATNKRNDLQQFCVDATEILNKYGAVEDGNAEAEYLELKTYFPLEQEGRTNAELYELKNDLQKLIECNNNLCKVLNVGTKLSDEWLDDYVDILEWRKRLEDLELEEQGMTEEKEQEKQEHYIDKILTDNGCEFADPELFEKGHDGKKRTRVFYCESRHSEQKGELEKNHEYIRYVLPKGSSFDGLNQEKVLRMVNHINNTTRPKLHGSTPMKKALKSFDKNAMEKLGLEIIPPDEICLKPELLK